MSNPPMPMGTMPSTHPQQMHQQQQQQRIPPQMNPQQQQLLYQQQQQQQIADDQKKLSDMIDGLNLLLSIRDDMNIILDNVAKSNPANTSLATKANEVTLAHEQLNKKPSYVANTPQPNQMTSSVNTPVSVNSTLSQQQQIQMEPETTQDNTDELLNLDSDQVQFLQITDTKFLQTKTDEISKNLK
jgi:hypothetical protein